MRKQRVAMILQDDYRKFVGGCLSKDKEYISESATEHDGTFL